MNADDLNELDNLEALDNAEPPKEEEKKPTDKYHPTDGSGDNDPMAPYLVRGLSKIQDQRVQRAKVVFAIVTGIILLFLSIFAMASVMAKDSKMVVNVEDELQGSLSLSETLDGFDNGSASSVLYATGIPAMDNIDGLTALASDITEDGSHNGENYVAYTFYLKNVGNAVIDSVTMEVPITLNLKNFGSAARLKIYTTTLTRYSGVFQENEPTILTYAKVASSGSAEPIDYYNVSSGSCENFQSESMIMTDTFRLLPSEWRKYTFVLWLEGNDPECTNSILGGSFGFAINFKQQA